VARAWRSFQVCGGLPVSSCTIVMQSGAGQNATWLTPQEHRLPSHSNRGGGRAGAPLVLLLTLDHELRVFEVLVTDFTELAYGGGKVWLMPILDSRSKLAVGHAVSRSRNRSAALEAWQRARRTLPRLGASIDGVIVHHDRRQRRLSNSSRLSR